MKKKKKYCGKIIIVGNQNSGKSTLLNKIIGKKISITSNKKNTTQENIIGIKTQKNYQFIYIDTPGFNIKNKMSKNFINKTLNFKNNIFRNLKIMILVIDNLIWNNKYDNLINFFKKKNIFIFIIINKIDKIKKKIKMLPFIKYIYKKYKINKIIPISSKTGENINVLEKLLYNYIPKKKHDFEIKKNSKISIKKIIHECIRETIMRYFGDELPYVNVIKVHSIKKNKNNEKIINVFIFIKNNRQKKIFIGKNGKKIKLYSMISRKNLEKILNKKIHLFLWIKIKK
ncbi:GTPase Era [Buchnera aphidicola (Periphyllus koelreuteriae)]|uniref:GTPase Era n=1 Tax=Buchnera aphidicola TaxID=9 RepID=UPI0031B8187A